MRIAGSAAGGRLLSGAARASICPCTLIDLNLDREPDGPRLSAFAFTEVESGLRVAGPDRLLRRRGAVGE